MDEAFPAVYDELRRLAAGYFRSQRPDHTLQPTALVHEAYLRLAEKTTGALRDRTHFFALAARIMRQILVDHARRRRAEKRGGGRRQVTLSAAAVAEGSAVVDVLALDEALTKLAALGERMSRVVELRFFGGLSVEEVARVLNASKRTIEADWFMARAWLRKELDQDGGDTP